MAQKYQVIARKYRPKTFRDVVGQDAAVTTLKNAIRFDKVAHAYLFCGSRGVGKTTLARLFAKSLNCQELGAEQEPCNQCPSCLEIASGQSLDVIEIDGASNRGIDDIRQINETVAYAPSHGKYKIYIIDEVHMLTKEAFNALLKTLEEPPEKVKFFFATTEPHKVLPTIISRCQRFDLARIQPALIASKLHQIGGDLNRIVEPEALHLIASFADGSLRDAESLLDQILCFAEGTITSSLVRQSLGLVPEEHFFALDRAFGAYDLAFAFELTDELFQTGKDLAHFLEQLIEHYRTLTVCKTRVEKIAPEILSRYLPSSRLYTQAQCLYILDLLIHAEAQFHKSSFQRISLESILLQIIRSKNRIPVEVLVRRLSELEDHLNQQNIGIPVAMPVEIEKSTAPIAPEPLILQNSEPEPALPVSPELKPIPFTPRKAPESVEVPVEVEKSTAPIAPELSASQNSEPKSAPPISVELKPVPFNPRKTPEPTPAPVFTDVPRKNPILPPPQTNELKAAPLSAKAHPSHYDTLMRFAAVELEGTLKKT